MNDRKLNFERAKGVEGSLKREGDDGSRIQEGRVATARRREEQSPTRRASNSLAVSRLVCQALALSVD
jgi:hypothetical protein